jgi:hypothetical protein
MDARVPATPRLHRALTCQAGAALAKTASPRMTMFTRDEPRKTRDYATAGTGSAVTDLIFSIAKREVTFFSGTALISFL